LAGVILALLLNTVSSRWERGDYTTHNDPYIELAIGEVE